MAAPTRQSRDTTATRRRMRALDSLRDSPGFRRLWLSNLCFFGGVWTQTLILGWMVFDSTGSEFLLALFTAVRLAPMLLGPFAGVLSDRFNRLKLLNVACGWAFGAVAVLALLATLDLAPYPVLLAGGLIIGLAQSPSQPARHSIVIELVGRENLSNANAWNAMAMNMMQVIGPAIGGAMISAVGGPVSLWVSASWYGLSLLVLRPLRGVGQIRAEHTESAFRMLAGGFREILRNRLAASALFVTLVANILIWPIYQSFMPVFAEKQLHLDAAGLGALLTCAGVGGLIGSVIIAALGDFRFKGGLFVIGTAAWGALWAVFALAHRPGVAFPVMAAIGLASAAFGVLQTTLLLMAAPSHVQGRALGLQELAIGVMPVSSLLLGVAAQTVGVGATTFVCGIALVVILAGLSLGVPQLLRYSGTDTGEPVARTAEAAG